MKQIMFCGFDTTKFCSAHSDKYHCLIIIIIITWCNQIICTCALAVPQFVFIHRKNQPSSDSQTIPVFRGILLREAPQRWVHGAPLAIITVFCAGLGYVITSE